MKLQELFETVNWNLKSEKQQIAMVKRSYNVIYSIDNPSEAVQQAAVSFYPYNITCLLDKHITPSENIQIAALTQNPMANISRMIKTFDHYNLKLTSDVITGVIHNNSYNYSVDFIKNYFKNNTILMNKWLRYAQNIRELTGEK